MKDVAARSEALITAKKLGLETSKLVFSSKLEWIGVDGEVRLRQVAVDDVAGRVTLYWNAMKARWREDEFQQKLSDVLQGCVTKFQNREFDESEHPRDEDGKFTFSGGGSGEFVSPNVGDLDFHGAVSGLSSERQKVLTDASADIDKQLNLTTEITGVVGAWQDGAENSIADFHGNTKWTDWPKVALSASMKGWLGNQKSVLAFQEKTSQKPRESKSIALSPKTKLMVEINPTSRDIRSMAKEDPVRILVDADGNLYAWNANEAIHSQVSNVLGLDEKHQDIWYLREGKLVSDREIPTNIPIDPKQVKDLIKLGAQEVRDKLASLEGNSVLLSFQAKGSLEDIHNNLLKDGLTFHTMIPNKEGAIVYAAAIDAKDVPATTTAVKTAAGRYGSKVTFRKGRGEFIGDGSGEPTRDRARSIYEDNIRRSDVYRSEAIWQSVHDNWYAKLSATEKIMIGSHFGRLTVLARAASDKHGNAMFVCACECGEQTTVRAFKLKSGHTQSCGCKRAEVCHDLQFGNKGKDNGRFSHGHTINGQKSPTYKSWEAMWQRCTNPNSPRWERYGGRGITVCERWLEFENFLADMGERPEDCSLDRYPNNDGNYELDNCRWATAIEQRANRSDSKKVEPLYVRRDLKNFKLVAAWAKDNGFSTTVDDMHVTIAYSKKPVDWDAAGDHGNSTLTIDTGSRSIAKLGDQGAVVLKFSSEALKQRWQEFIDAGASWDWPNYQSHVTISFDAGDVDLDDITPYTGELVFGPEIFQKIDPNWKDNVSEKGLLERFNPNHEPAGSPEGGQFTSGDGGEGGGGSTSSGSFTHPSGKTWQQVAQTAVDKWKEGHPQVKAATVALKKDIDQAMAEAPQFEHYRDWYARHIPLAKKLFGDNEPYFEKFLAATSINASGKPNVDMALRATIHFINGGTFEAKNYKGVMGAIRTELLKVQNNEPLTGLKVVPFAQVLLGDWDHAPADRHMKNLLFQKPSEGPNKSQAEVTEVVFRAIAKEMGWKTAEIQAVLWCVDKAREEKGNSKNVFDYLQYMKTEEAKVRTLLVEHQQLKTSAAFKKSFDEDEVGDALEQEADAWSNAQLTLEYFQAIHDEVGDNPTPEDIADALDMLTEQKDFDESKHPRDDHGRFSDGGGDSESTSSPKGDGSDYAFFHGTADSLIASIKEHGLVPTGEQPKELGKEIAGADKWARDHHMAVGRHNIGNRATSVYVASHPVLAAAFAKIVVANHPGSKPVVLAIRVPEKEIEKHIVPDEWSDIPDAYRFIGKIPPDWIVDIGKFDPDTIPNLADHDQKRSFIEDLQREKNGDVIVHAVIIADEEKNEP